MTEQRNFSAAIRGNSIDSTDDFRAWYISDSHHTLIEGVTTKSEPELIKDLKKQFGSRYISCASTTNQDEGFAGIRVSTNIAAVNAYYNWKK